MRRVGFDRLGRALSNPRHCDAFAGPSGHTLDGAYCSAVTNHRGPTSGVQAPRHHSPRGSVAGFADSADGVLDESAIYRSSISMWWLGSGGVDAPLRPAYQLNLIIVTVVDLTLGGVRLASGGEPLHGARSANLAQDLVTTVRWLPISNASSKRCFGAGSVQSLPLADGQLRIAP